MHKPRKSTAFICVVLAAAAGCRRQSADEHSRRAAAYAEQKHYSEAVIEYRTAVQIDPRRGDLRTKLGDVYLLNGDGAGALREYVRAADLLPTSAEAQLKAGNLLLVARAYEDAKTRAQNVLAIDAKNVEAQILRGNALAGLRDLDGAIKDYEEAIARDPSNSDAYAYLGAIQTAGGKLTEAEATFKAAITAAPNLVPARLALANFYWATRRQADSERAFREALDLEPKNPDANRALGSFYLATGRGKEAEPYFQSLASATDNVAARLTLAQYYMVMKRFDDGRRVLDELAKRSDAYAPASVRLAALDASQGKRAEAKARVRDVLTKAPKDFSALLLNAVLLKADRQHDEALSMVNAALAVDSNSATAHLEAGRILADADRTEEAIKEYELAMRMDARPFAAALELASLHFGLGATAKALTYAQQAIAMQGQSPEARNLLTRIYLRQGDIAKARAELALLEKALPNAPGVLKLSALTALADHQTAAARTAYDRVLQGNPGDLEALAGLLQLDMTEGHASDAKSRLDATLARQQPTPELLLLAARGYLAAGDLDKTEHVLRRAIDADPVRLEGYTMLGQVYARQNRLDEAIQQYQDVLKRNPRAVAASTMIGMLLEGQGRVADAEKQYQRVLAVDPQAAIAANNLAYIYAASNRNLDQALQLAQTAKAQMPDEPQVSDTVGWVYVKKNMASAAIPHLEMSAKKTPDDPVAQYHLGMAYVQSGDWDKAKVALKRALTLKADFGGADEARKALETIGA